MCAPRPRGPHRPLSSNLSDRSAWSVTAKIAFTHPANQPSWRQLLQVRPGRSRAASGGRHPPHHPSQAPKISPWYLPTMSGASVPPRVLLPSFAPAWLGRFVHKAMKVDHSSKYPHTHRRAPRDNLEDTKTTFQATAPAFVCAFYPLQAAYAQCNPLTSDPQQHPLPTLPRTF